MRIVEKIFSSNAGNIYYWTCFVEKNLPWLVFLPGLTGDRHLFDRQIVELGKKYNCFVWDAPGHGKSRPFALNFSMDDMAEYLYCILKAEEIQKPVLVGQSLGGYISQVYMELHPGSTAGFVSIDSVPLTRKYYVKPELALFKRMEGIYLSIPWQALTEWVIAAVAVTRYGKSVMRWMLKQYEREELCALAAHGYRMIAEAVETGRTYEIACPSLLLCGEKDIFTVKLYNRLWMREDGHILVWVPNAGHNANCDAPDFVNGKINQFIQFLQL